MHVLRPRDGIQGHLNRLGFNKTFVSANIQQSIVSWFYFEINEIAKQTRDVQESCNETFPQLTKDGVNSLTRSSCREKKLTQLIIKHEFTMMIFEGNYTCFRSINENIAEIFIISTS